MPLFFMGSFLGDFQEGKRPIKAFGETPHYSRKTAHQGRETHHERQWAFFGLHAMVENGPSKKAH